MRVTLKPPSADKIDTRPTSQATSLPGQVVLVLQGGGALGAYQAGVYQALHEAGIEPDWIIGTSVSHPAGAHMSGTDGKPGPASVAARTRRRQAPSVCRPETGGCSDAAGPHAADEPEERHHQSERRLTSHTID
jgi:hypothetical protein